MTCLKCSVDNCANYAEHKCCLPMIEVSGQESDSRYQTCCSSFISKSEGATNSTQESKPSTESEIRCSAEKCIHHREDDTCDAGCVCVGSYSHDATCCDETQCETFANTSLQNIHGK